MTYLAISVPFLLLAAGIAVTCRKAHPRNLWVTVIVLAILFGLTIIFDNLMIWAGLVGYSDAQRLGIDIGLMPIEDLLYPLFAALIVPALWPGKVTK